MLIIVTVLRAKLQHDRPLRLSDTTMLQIPQPAHRMRGTSSVGCTFPVGLDGSRKGDPQLRSGTEFCSRQTGRNAMARIRLEGALTYVSQLLALLLSLQLEPAMLTLDVQY